MVSNAYLQYLQTVLGVKEILLPTHESGESPSSGISPAEARQAWQFWGQAGEPFEVLSLITHESQSLQTEVVSQLWLKMLGAMSSSMPSPKIYEGFVDGDQTDLRAEWSARDVLTLVFCVEESLLPEEFARFGVWQNFLGRRCLATHHPSVLLRQPEKKRAAWGHLQQVMKEIAGEN